MKYYYDLKNSFLFECILIIVVIKAEFSAPLLQSSLSHDPSEISLICWFAAHETFMITNINTNISLPIIPCMIVYVTNNKEPWEPWTLMIIVNVEIFFLWKIHFSAFFKCTLTLADSCEVRLATFSCEDSSSLLSLRICCEEPHKVIYQHITQSMHKAASNLKE